MTEYIGVYTKEPSIMKIDRLIGILSILLQKETETIPSLARQFEVSPRTISRDIETLCQAGIPIMTRRGMSGGISIMEGYKIDRTLLTSAEMQDILAGLRSLDSVNGTNRYSQLMEKLSAGSSDFISGNQSLLIDLSSWYKDSLAPKIERIFPGGIRVKALFQPECKWRLIEDFGTECFEKQKDGSLLFRADYTDKRNLISYLLTFGDKVRLLEPEEVRLELKGIISKMLENYQ